MQPGVAGSVRCEEVPEPDERDGSILVEAVAVGICGTDAEIASGACGWAPPGQKRLILGHESLGRVVDPSTLLTAGRPEDVTYRLVTDATGRPALPVRPQGTWWEAPSPRTAS